MLLQTKYILTIFCAIAITTIACIKPITSQEELGVHNSWIIATETNAGTVQVDEKGNPLTKGSTTNYAIFLESEIDQPITWKTAFINGNAYTITTTSIAEKTIAVGKKIDSDEKLMFESKKANCHILQLDLSLDEPSTKYNYNKIVIEGVQNNKEVQLNMIDTIIKVHPLYERM